MVKLPYAYDALAPNIDAKTMEIHYSKHYKKYTDELNKATKGTPLEGKTIEELFATLDPENKAVRNNGGGFYNHNLFWEIMAPKAGGEPKGALAEAINKDFGSFENFKTQFSEAATKQFGSGWAFLVKTGDKVEIKNYANQNCPVSDGVTALLTIDVWEHAYYLKFQNRRPEWVDTWWNVVNWKTVAERFGA